MNDPIKYREHAQLLLVNTHLIIQVGIGHQTGCQHDAVDILVLYPG
jgi:hypothetical protein